MAIQDTLPDPNNRINAAGEDTSGSYGPGFSSVQLTSTSPIVTNKSNSGLSFRTLNSYHQWEIQIKYNNLTKAEFDVVYPYLLERQASLEAFFVELPQYGNSTAGSKNINNTSEAGSNKLFVDSTADINVGDLFHVADVSDDVHVKAYKVTKITSSPNTLTISPPLQRKVTYGSQLTQIVVFGTPRIRVVVPDRGINYTINSNGLYSFSVKLEESLA